MSPVVNATSWLHQSTDCSFKMRGYDIVLEVMPKSIYIAGKKVTVRYKLQKLQILLCMSRICQQIKVYAIKSLTNDHFCYCGKEKCFIASTQVQQLCTCHREIQKELASTSGS
jgi:hypothetical protein